MASLYTTLGQWQAGRGYKSNVMRGLGGSHLAHGSANAMIDGTDHIRAFYGMSLLGGKIGSRQQFVVDQAYAGLGVDVSAVQGSVFQVRELLTYVGSGQVTYDGLALAGIVASSTLSLLKKAAGVYAAGATTGPFQAGHAQPSAPVVYAKTNPSAGKTPMSGAISVVCWRVSIITGQVSLMSLPSNVVTLSAQSAIVQVPLVDSNGQTHWGFGVPKIGYGELGFFLELPTSLGGEVAETTIAYTRVAGTVTFASGSTTATVDGGVTSADIGRRVTDGTFDTWIVSIVDGTHVTVNDTPGANSTGAGTITGAVDGITRAVEISWTNGALQEQDLAPDRAFPPPACQFAGAMSDVEWAEADGIIYVGDPGQVGSFPPKNAIFAPGAAVLFLRTEDKVTIRFETNSVGALYYVGGSPALEYQTVIENQGIKYAQNAFLGMNNRVLAWFGVPTEIDNTSLEPDPRYASDVLQEFAGWGAAQTATLPIVGGYDPKGKYECWCFQKKVMAKYAPTGDWCAPIDLTGKITGDIVSAVTTAHTLYLSTWDGASTLLYEFDAGTGSVMVVQFDDVQQSPYGNDTINQVFAQVRADNTANNVLVQIIVNGVDAAPVTVFNALPAAATTIELPAREMQPNILNVGKHTVRFTMTSTGGDCGVDWALTKGSVSEAL